MPPHDKSSTKHQFSTSSSSYNDNDDISTNQEGNSNFAMFAFRDDAKISGKNENTFPFRLIVMLEAAETERFSHITSWIGETSFKVHDQDAFVEEVMPRFFQQTKYKSFQGQCNLWGFDRINNGPGKGGYTRNELFSRSLPNLVAEIRRQKIKGPLSKRRCRTASSTLPTSKAVATRRASARKTKATTTVEAVRIASNDVSIYRCEVSYDLLNSPFETAPAPVCSENDVLISSNDLNETLDFGDLDTQDLDFFVNSDHEEMDMVLNDLFGADSTPFSSSTQPPAYPSAFKEDAPIVYLDSSESGIPKSSLIDWLVLEKKAARQRSPDITAAPLPDTLEKSEQKKLSPICALLRKGPRPVSPSTPWQINSLVALAFAPPMASCSAFTNPSSSSSSINSDSSTKSSQFISFACKPIASQLA